MFSRKNRIPRAVLNKIISKKDCFLGEFFNLKTFQNNQKIKRFAIIVSKKNFKTSVKRHLIKRKYASVVRFFEKKLKNEQDYVFFIKKESQNLSFKDLKIEFERFFEKNSL